MKNLVTDFAEGEVEQYPGRCCWGRGTKGTKCTRLTPYDWKHLLQDQENKSISQKLWDLCNNDSLTSEEREKRKDELKRQLLWITPHTAEFRENERKNSNALVRSGLVMADIDHIDDPRGLWEAFVAKGGLEKFSVVLAHITPSCRGLRIIFEAITGNIAEDQHAMYAFLGLPAENCDEVVKDYARISFLPTDGKFLLHVDAKLFSGPTGGEITDADHEPLLKEENLDAHATPTGAEPIAAAPAVTEYEGIDIAAITERFLCNQKEGRLPRRGERNTRLLAAARELTTITDGDAASIYRALRALPLDEPLGDDELQGIVRSAVAYKQSRPSGRIGDDLSRAISQLILEREEEEEKEGKEPREADKLPPLPPVIKELVAIAPPTFRHIVPLIALPPLGTVTTRLRASYGTDEQFPGFQTILYGPQASGKGSAEVVTKTIMNKVHAHDEVSHLREEEYRKECQKIKRIKKGDIDIADLPDKPAVFMQELPPNISRAKIFDRMQASPDLTMYSYTAELDSMTMNSKQAWSNLNDLMRKGFDGSASGKDSVNDESFNGTIEHTRYNYLACGTPIQVRRFIPDVENGLVSRIIFAPTAKDQPLTPPQWGRLSAKQQGTIDERLEAALHMTYITEYDDEGEYLGEKIAPTHELNLRFLSDAMLKWTKEKGLQARISGSNAAETFRRRAAVIGFRAGMVAWWLYGERNTPATRKNTEAFALWVAEETLKGQIALWGKAIEDNAAREKQLADAAKVATQPTKQEMLYEALPEVFTAEDVDKLVHELNLKTPRKKWISKLVKCGAIVKTADNQWKKLIAIPSSASAAA